MTTHMMSATTHAGKVLAFALAMFAFGCLLAHLLSCASAKAKSEAADATYATELMKCTDTSKTLAESRACEAQVDIRWHVVDGGVSK